MRVIRQRAVQSPWPTDPERWCFDLVEMERVVERIAVVGVGVEVVVLGFGVAVAEVVEVEGKLE